MILHDTGDSNAGPIMNENYDPRVTEAINITASVN
jgi:hypothetical protein